MIENRRTFSIFNDIRSLRNDDINYACAQTYLTFFARCYTIATGDDMKKIIALISVFLAALSLIACDTVSNTETEKSDTGDATYNMEIMQYLKNNISAESTVDEIIAVFEEMCKTPVEDDLLLFEYGAYNFTGQTLFYFDLVRQYPDGEGEFYQLRVSLKYPVDEENKDIYDTVWGDEDDGDFFQHIKESAGYEYAKNHKFVSFDIRTDQT